MNRARAVSALALGALLAAGCADEPVAPPAAGEPVILGWSGDLDAEIKAVAHVSLRRDGGALHVELGFAQLETKQLFDASVSFTADGRVVSLPETGSELFTATFSAAPSPPGPCGAEPVALALSLHRRAPNHRFGGSLAAYCGAEARGVPVRIFRLSGSLAPVTP